jgi:hypothetical protein
MEDPARLDRAPCADTVVVMMLTVRLWDKLTILIEKWLLNPGRTSTPVHRESLLEFP